MVWAGLAAGTMTIGVSIGICGLPLCGRQAIDWNDCRDRLVVANNDQRLIALDHRLQGLGEQLTSLRHFHRLHDEKLVMRICTKLVRCTAKRTAGPEAPSREYTL